MAEFNNQIDEIKTLITSNSKSDKSIGYSMLLHIQEQSIQHSSAIEALSKRVCHLLLSIIADISDEDEEIASQALKCLGFMIYHPSLVTAVLEDVAHLVVESLVKLITTTKIKAVCNLGVWCISMQQLNASFLARNFHSLLRAIIHALDNPIGSLSTTFEAMQAVIKLAAQLTEKMRDTSNIWVPVIYRRLLSSDKRERDMTERCLLKIKPTIIPPTLNLSKALVVDMKKKLLYEMKEVIQDRGRKVHTIQAWGWYIRLLGSHALKNRQLVNEMLKIPEQTFSDFDPQVQTASQVAWEGLIDALIHPPSEAPRAIMASGHVAKQRSSMTLDNCNFENMGKALVHVAQQRSSMTLNRCNYENSEDGLSKSLRLVMTPLVGILSSKCDISVRSFSLNTWCYLLHKLDLEVNCPTVLKTVIEPIFEVVFQMGTDDKNRWLWNICLDLLDDYILANNGDRDNGLSQQVSCCSSTKISSLGHNNGSQGSFKDYPIKWLPWDLTKLGLPIKVIHILISQGSLTHLTPECKTFACKSALKAFRSVLKGIQIELKKSSINYGEIMLCLNTILSLTKQVFEDATSKQFDDLLCTSLHLVGVVREEIEPSVLASPLYKVAMDFKYISELQTIVDIEYPKVPEISYFKYMDMVSPTVYLTTLYLCMGARSISDSSRMEMILHGLEKHLRFVLSSYNHLENIYAILNLLYKHNEFAWLKIWLLIANVLKEHIDSFKDIPSLKFELDSDGYAAVSWFLAYPFLVCLYPKKLSILGKTSCSSDLSFASSRMEFESIIEVWKSLYASVNRYEQSNSSAMTTFSEDLCGILNKVFNEKSIKPNGGIELCLKDKHQNLILQLLSGEVAICLLNQVLVFYDDGLRSKGSSGECFQPTSIKNILEFIARVFSALASFVGRLCLKCHILLLVEVCLSHSQRDFCIQT
ncbi:hypothetical protein AQUCO_02000070v1 [Aquilegia coerulea]|uniref:Telomere-associated protein Rif1 N-terminal domain-containing protein n=1 Tax=Aquilegia coerulea TaxID=218851 RepID=A0A2G5DGK6_AQUCA|nr:hypothetical protein AQUCO_02000070v1 [Aquilegia coerulea]